MFAIQYRMAILEQEKKKVGRITLFLLGLSGERERERERESERFKLKELILICLNGWLEYKDWPHKMMAKLESEFCLNLIKILKPVCPWSQKNENEEKIFYMRRRRLKNATFQK